MLLNYANAIWFQLLQCGCSAGIEAKLLMLLDILVALTVQEDITGRETMMDLFMSLGKNTFLICKNKEHS